MNEYFSYENYGTNTYLKFTFPKDLEVDEFTLGMITNNKIDGFLQSIYGSMDDTKYIKYNISSKISVSQFFSGTVNKRKLISVFHGILLAFITAEDYMIEPKNIILDLDYIFVNVSSCQVEMVCLPCDISKNENDMLSFFKNLIFTLNFDQSENCDYIAKLINYLNSAGTFSYADFKNVVDSIYETLAQQDNSVAYNVPRQAAPIQNSQITNNGSAQGVIKQPQQLSGGYMATSGMQNSSNSAAVMERPIQQPNINAQANVPVSQTKQPVQAIPAAPKAKIPMSPSENMPIIQKTDEKPMTMMYLLQHYNKENAAIYKAQKQARKNGNSMPNASQNNPAQTPNVVKSPAQQAAPIKPIPQQQAVGNTPNMMSGYQTSAPQQNNNTQASVPYNQEFSKMNSTQPAFGDTTVLNSKPRLGETTVLNMNGGDDSQGVKLAYLIRKKNGERISITKNSFYIGKEKSFVDYFIADNPAISRSHANIITKNGEYYIVDTNSTNHTFINGEMIPSGVEIKLESGCEIMLANEKFDFQIL